MGGKVLIIRSTEKSIEEGKLGWDGEAEYS